MTYDILKKMFDKESPKSVFEVGCANGGLLKDLDDTFHLEKIGGADIDKNDLIRAKEILPNGLFLLHDVTKLFPLPDKSYDIVFCCGVLMYIVNPITTVREMLRVGKKVIIAEPYDNETDDVGRIDRVDMTPGKTHHGIVRNYMAFFKNFHIPFTITSSGTGKAIIKL